MNKKVEKHVKIKILPIIIMFFLVGLAFLGYYLFTFIPIKNIYIIGNTNLTDQEIIEIAKIDDYPSFLKTTSSSIKKRLLSNEYIKSVSVKKKLFAKVYIEVTEEKLLFRDNETNLVVTNSDVKIDDNNKYQLPLLLNYVPDTKYKSFITGMSKVDESIRTQISEIRYYPNEQDSDRFLLYMNDGNYVYLTLTRFKQINYYEEVLDELGGKKGILYLDSGNHFKIMEN